MNRMQLHIDVALSLLVVAVAVLQDARDAVGVRVFDLQKSSATHTYRPAQLAVRTTER